MYTLKLESKNRFYRTRTTTSDITVSTDAKDTKQ
jgi:hypothetical protein